MTPLLHSLTGLAYWLGVGGLSAVLVHRAWRAWAERPRLRDGLGRWLAGVGRWLVDSGAGVFVGLVWMALSCAPHHLEWGAHLFDGTPTGLDTLTIWVALPPGAAWLYWQSAAVFPQLTARWSWWRPDVTIPGRSLAPPAIFTALVAYCTTIFALNQPDRWTGQVYVQTALIVAYLVVAMQWWAGQQRRRLADGVWSGKGITLGVIWATCAMNHWSWAVGVGDGVYRPDWHMLAIDGAIGIPAATSFIVLVWWLQRQSATA